MKPLKLVMQAFESYGARTEIDFTKVNQNLFLIAQWQGDQRSGTDAPIRFIHAAIQHDGREAVAVDGNRTECF